MPEIDTFHQKSSLEWLRKNIAHSIVRQKSVDEICFEKKILVENRPTSYTWLQLQLIEMRFQVTKSFQRIKYTTLLEMEAKIYVKILI